MVEGRALCIMERMYASVDGIEELRRRCMVESGIKVRLEVRQVFARIAKRSGRQGSVGPEGEN